MPLNTGLVQNKRNIPGLEASSQPITSVFCPGFMIHALHKPTETEGRGVGIPTGV